MRNTTIWGGVVLAIWGVGCGDDAAKKPTVALGIVLDQTANSAAPSWGYSAQLAIDHLNAALKKSDASYRLSAAFADSASNAAVTVERASELVKKKGAKGLVLDLSRSSIETNKLNYSDDEAKRLNVPQICILCTSTDINNPSVVKEDPVEQAALRNEQGWQYRTATRQDYIIDVILRTILTAGDNGDGDHNGDGQVRVSLYNANDNSGRNFRTQFESSVLAANANAEIENVYVEPNVDLNDHDWEADLAKLMDNVNEDAETASAKTTSAPDAIFESVTAGFAIAMSKAYAQGDRSIPFYHAHGFRHPLVSLLLGNDINGQEGVSHAVLDNGASGTVFAEALTDETGLAPQYLDSAAYDATVLLGLAVIAAARDLEDPSSVTGEAVRDALKTLNDLAGTEVRTGPSELTKAVKQLTSGATINYEGASGSVDFDENGDARGKLAHYKGVNGQWVDQQLYDCTKPGCPTVD